MRLSNLSVAFSINPPMALLHQHHKLWAILYITVSLFLFPSFLFCSITSKSGVQCSFLLYFYFFASHHITFRVPLVWPSERVSRVHFLCPCPARERGLARHWNDLYTFSNVALIWQSNKSKEKWQLLSWAERKIKRKRGTCRGHHNRAGGHQSNWMMCSDVQYVQYVLPPKWTLSQLAILPLQKRKLHCKANTFNNFFQC